MKGPLQDNKKMENTCFSLPVLHSNMKKLQRTPACLLQIVICIQLIDLSWLKGRHEWWVR